VTSPEDGSLSFDPDGLEASAGEITLAYENPSTLPHNIALESEGETLETSDTITQDTVELSADLAPGEYIFFCAVAGHREAGMEGTLTVQ
jgi:plastocyanin